MSRLIDPATAPWPLKVVVLVIHAAISLVALVLVTEFVIAEVLPSSSAIADVVGVGIVAAGVVGFVIYHLELLIASLPRRSEPASR